MKNKKDLKKSYVKIEKIYGIYDTNNNDLCLGIFDTLEDLYNYLKDNNFTNEKTKISTIASLKAIISQHNLINNRLEIVKICLD